MEDYKRKIMKDERRKKTFEIRRACSNLNLNRVVCAGPKICVVTWGDSDVMTALHSELSRLQIERPPHFDKWINLKVRALTVFLLENRGLFVHR